MHACKYIFRYVFIQSFCLLLTSSIQVLIMCRQHKNPNQRNFIQIKTTAALKAQPYNKEQLNMYSHNLSITKTTNNQRNKK